MSRQHGLPHGGILGHGLGHRGGPPALHPAAQLRPYVGRVLPQRLSHFLARLLVANVPPRPVLVFLEESAGRIEPTDPTDNVVGNVGLFQLARLGAEVGGLLAGDDGPELDVAGMGVDPAAAAGQDVVDVGGGDGTDAPGQDLVGRRRDRPGTGGAGALSW